MNITQEHINNKLRILKSRLLKSPYKEYWSKDNPTYGYCYIISEALYHYLEGEYIPQCINFGKDKGTHWYLKNKSSGAIVDFTADQFDFDIDYTKGRGIGFMKGKIPAPKGFISVRGYEMAKLLKLIV